MRRVFEELGKPGRGDERGVVQGGDSVRIWSRLGKGGNEDQQLVLSVYWPFIGVFAESDVPVHATHLLTSNLGRFAASVAVGWSRKLGSWMTILS